MRYKYKINFCFFSFLLLLPVFIFSQNLNGIPFIRNYSPNEYGTSSDNWAIVQDKRGVMYFGNASGVLEYDGTKWVLIPVSNTSLVRSIAIDSNGIIYVGAVGEFGFLEPDEKGKTIYHSLVDKLPAQERVFSDVWKTYATRDGVYFQTFSKLIRFKNNLVKIWKPKTSFHFSYYVNNKFYVNEREKGLKYISNENLIPVTGGEFFAGLRIYGMLPYPGNKILIATRERGLIQMNEEIIEKDSVFKYMNAEVNNRLINDQVYGAVAIDNNRYAFATLKKGVLIIDIYGNIIQSLNKKNGLQEDIVKYVSVDDQHDLWIALEKGISRVEISSPLNSLNDAQGLNGSIKDIIKFKGLLYAATSLGVYASTDNHFVSVQGISSSTWALKKFIFKQDTFLLASSGAGVYKIEKENSSLLKEGFGYFIYQSKINPERVFIGMNDGLSSMRYENRHWIDEDYFNGIDKEIRSIAEDAKGNLWLGTPFDGLLKVSFKNKKESADTLVTSWNATYKIQNYDTVNGLPEMKYNIPYNFKSKIVFATTEGIYEYNEKTDSFHVSSFLKEELSHHQVYRFASKDSSAVWLFTVPSQILKETGVAYLQKDNSYSWYSLPFLRVSDREIHTILPDEKGITWLGGPDGLLRYDSSIKKNFAQPFHALIRRVVAGKDSIFGGNFYSVSGDYNISEINQPDLMKPEIKYDFNSFKFEFSAASFGTEQSNLFTFYLEGFDKEWSDFSIKHDKEYTNLKEGNYTFHVKAKNIYGTESIEATYQFKILPPWYRTLWAYAGYVIAFIGFVYLIIRISIRRLVKAKNKLEETVKERTAEVVEQKHLIEEKHKEITDSINYAERIQRSFLATKELLDQNLTSTGSVNRDYFVFFQPKDVVSGDFYWAGTVGSKQEAVGSEQPVLSDNKKFILVTADSTGHGVPGAIMSILNITSLEKAIENGSIEPSAILNKTRENIIERLKKDGSAEGGKDGMDASLICFDFANSKITYAAANNPVWIVRNKEMIELAPDKMPVGKHDNDKVSFSQHIIDLQKGDMIYALTDGMPDQFGGPKGKKFMYKKLKEFLISISHLSMTEQKESIKTALNDWKGDLEQVDDVCLIGIRF